MVAEDAYSIFIPSEEHSCDKRNTVTSVDEILTMYICVTIQTSCLQVVSEPHF